MTNHEVRFQAHGYVSEPQQFLSSASSLTFNSALSVSEVDTIRLVSDAVALHGIVGVLDRVTACQWRCLASGFSLVYNGAGERGISYYHYTTDPNLPGAS